MSQCASVEQIQRLLANELSGPEAEIVEIHIEGCALCQRTLADLVSSASDADPQVTALSSSAPSPTIDESSEGFLCRLEKHPPSNASELSVHPDTKTLSSAESSGTVGWKGPQTVAGYEILGLLGRGGMGSVYKAWQQKLNRLVALKMVRGGTDARPDELVRFRVEAEAVARLQHSNIVQIYEVGTQDGLPFFAMEYVDGGNLARQLRGTPFPVRRAAQLTEVLARAMHYAHLRGIVHRDLTPANILVLADGTPKITDFGLAKILIGGGATQTLSGAIMGTPSYMPPEQAAGRTREVGPATDVYALGAILYEMLTGRPPFRAETQLETIRQVGSEEPVPPRRLQPRLPQDLETICLKCLQKEPRKRYTSALALADDLQCFLADKPITARRTSVPERTWRWCRRNRAVAALTAFVFLLLVVITLISSLTALWLRRERDTALSNLHRAESAEAEARSQQEQTLEALRRAEAAERDALNRLWASYLAEARASRWSGLAGRRFRSLEALAKAAAIRPTLELRNEVTACLALVDLQPGRTWNGNPPGTTGLAFDSTLQRYARGDRPGTVSIRRIGDDSELVRLPGAGLPAVPLQFSSDGRLLLVRYDGGKGSQIQAWDLERVEAILKIPPGECGGRCDLSADGRQLASSRQDGSIDIYDLPARTRRQRLAGTLEVYRLRFHPKGGQLAVARSNRSLLQVFDLSTGKAIHSFGHAGAVNEIAWSPDGKQLASACADFRIYIWDTASGRALKTDGHQSQATHVCFNHRGDLLASLGWDSTLRLWDPHTGKQLLSNYTGSSSALQFSLDDRVLGFALQGAEISLWEVAPGRQLRTLRGHDKVGKGPWTVAISPDERLLASGSGDGVVLWDLATGTELAFLPVGVGRPAREIQLDRVSSCAGLFASGGTELITAGRQTLLRWPLAAGSDSAAAGLHIGPPQRVRAGDLSWHWLSQAQDGRIVAAVADGGEAIVFDRDRPGKEVALGHHPGMLHVAVSPDGKYVAAAAWFQPGGISVWEAESGKCLQHWATGNGHIAFSPDSKWLVTGTPQEYAFWKVGSWQPGRRIVRDHAALGGPLAFSEDGKMLATAISDYVIRLVDPVTGDELATLDAADRQLLSALCFSPKGSYLAATTENHAIQLWNLGSIRASLAKMHLDWPGSSPLPAETVAAVPPAVRVDMGDLLPPLQPSVSEPVRLRHQLLLWSLQRDLVPYHPEPYHQRGHVYEKVNQPDKAVDDFTQALRWQPAHPRSQAHLYESRALNLRRLKKNAEAERDLQRAYALQPNDANVSYFLAVLYFFNLNDASKALPPAERAVQLAPDNVPHRYLLGLVHYQLGHYAPAFEAFERMIQNNNGQANARELFYMAICQRHLGDAAKADDYFARAVQWLEDRQGQLSPDESKRLNTLRAQAESVLVNKPTK